MTGCRRSTMRWRIRRRWCCWGFRSWRCVWCMGSIGECGCGGSNCKTFTTEGTGETEEINTIHHRDPETQRKPLRTSTQRMLEIRVTKRLANAERDFVLQAECVC